MKRLLIPLTAALAVFAMAAPAAFASTKQVTMVLDNLALSKSPAATLATLTKLHDMGVTMVKYSVSWAYYAPNASSTTTPAGATSNPGLYDAYGQFGLIDALDQDAAKLGIRVGLLVTDPVPRWAEGSAGCAPSNITAGACRPNPAEFKTFVEALGQRYSGSYVDPSTKTKLPAVTWWSIYNEPNYIPNIAPQTTGSSTYVAADIYRGLLNAAYAGLKATGHANSTFIFGELAPRGISSTKAGNGAGIKPVQFLASLYCVTTAGKRLTGAAASAIGCPSSAAAFKSANPALFDASGIADHPYAQGVPPNVPTYDCTLAGIGATACQNDKTKKADPLWTDLASISNLENGLAKDLKVYGSTKKFAIWSTEYGFWATPSTRALTCRFANQADCAINPTTAAYYDNWAEYISYMNPRIASFCQYQLYEPTSGNWTDGLLSQSGAPRTAYAAFEVPLFMPTTTAPKAGSLKVWGGARPATTLKSAADKVKIQFKAKSGGWKTLKTVTVSQSTGYFSTSVKFTASGSVRLLYQVTKTVSLAGRTQAITVK